MRLLKPEYCDKILMVNKMNYVYIVKCADGTLYTGWTTDVEKRIKAHNEKRGAKYTKSRLPVELFYREECESKSEAMKREARIKKLTRWQKLQLKNR